MGGKTGGRNGNKVVRKERGKKIHVERETLLYTREITISGYWWRRPSVGVAPGSEEG